MVDPELTIAYARECMGTQWVHQGRMPGVAIDCAGLAVHVMKRHGLPYHDPKGYPRTPYDGKLKKTLDANPHLQQIPAMEDGSLLLMRTAKEPQHLAFWTGEKIVHASCDVGKVAEQRLPENERYKIVAIYRITDER